MKNQIWKITRSLCAVFLAAGLTFASMPFAVYADETTEDTTIASVVDETTTVETTTEATTEESTTEETTTEATTEETSTEEITTEATTEETTTEETTIETTTEETSTEEITTETTTEEITTEETTAETTTEEITTEETTVETTTEETTVETTTEETTTEETTAETTTEETTTEETTTETNSPISTFDIQPTSYVYNVTVEFGYFSFYYDFGIWDVTSFEYRASDSSNNPGANTTLHEPGWYGFDGVNNRIYIENNSPFGTQDLLITISFDDTLDEDGEVFPVKNVEMSLYAHADDVNPLVESGETWSVPNRVYYDENGDVQIAPETVYLQRIAADSDGDYSIYLPSGNGMMRNREVYISLSGEPQVKDSEDDPFFAATMTKLGFITVGISLVDGG